MVSFLYSRVVKELCMGTRKIREELFELRVCNDDSKTLLVYTTVENFFSAVKKDFDYRAHSVAVVSQPQREIQKMNDNIY